MTESREWTVTTTIQVPADWDEHFLSTIVKAQLRAALGYSEALPIVIKGIDVKESE